MRRLPDPGSAGKRNALDLRCVEELRLAIGRLADDRSIRAVTVNGAGQSVFCAGLEFDDIFRIDGRNNPFTAACDELAALPAPTVCAVRDGAYGAGADLALACDFRVGTPDCRVRVPAAALGVHYDGSGLVRSIRTMGMQGARRLFLAAETLFAEDLLRIGFLDEIASATDLDRRVEIRVRNLASLAPVAVRDLKRSIAELASGEAGRTAGPPSGGSQLGFRGLPGRCDGKSGTAYATFRGSLGGGPASVDSTCRHTRSAAPGRSVAPSTGGAAASAPCRRRASLGGLPGSADYSSFAKHGLLASGGRQGTGRVGLSLCNCPFVCVPPVDWPFGLAAVDKACSVRNRLSVGKIPECGGAAAGGTLDGSYGSLMESGFARPEDAGQILVSVDGLCQYSWSLD